MSQKNSYTIMLQGGLGNQLFGWAAAMSLALKNNGTAQVSNKLLKFSNYELGKYTHEPKIADKNIMFFLNRFNSFKEKDFRFDDRFQQLTKGVTLRGYYQSWKYFDHCKDEIRKTFTAISNISIQYENLLKQLQSEPYTAIHVRRGDYVGLKSYHGLTTREYFSSARAIVSKQDNTQKVVVFSDDIHSAKEVVDWGDVYIGKNDLENPVETLDLLSRGENIIGSNSSFSWWGSYLRDTESGIRIMPRPWFANPDLNERDLLCPSWITLGI